MTGEASRSLYRARQSLIEAGGRLLLPPTLGGGYRQAPASSLGESLGYAGVAAFWADVAALARAQDQGETYDVDRLHEVHRLLTGLASSTSAYDAMLGKSSELKGCGAAAYPHPSPSLLPTLLRLQDMPWRLQPARAP